MRWVLRFLLVLLLLPVLLLLGLTSSGADAAPPAMAVEAA